MWRDPKLEDMLNDPIIQVLMRRDGVTAEMIRNLMQRLRARRTSPASR